MSYIKEAEQKVVNNAKMWDDMLQLVQAFENFGNKTCHDYIAKDEFFSGLQKIKKAIYSEYVFSLSKCFCFVGVGGDEASEFSKQKFKEIFSEDQRVSVMHFLDTYGQIPSSWKTDVEEQFRKDAKEVINK